MWFTIVVLIHIFPGGSWWQMSFHVLIQFSAVAQLYETLRPRRPQHARPPCPSPSPGAYSNMSIESVMPSSHLILCRPLLLPPSIFPSIRVFSDESVLHIRWPKYWCFNFSISPVVFPGGSHGQRNLVGYSPWAVKSQTWLKHVHECHAQILMTIALL